MCQIYANRAYLEHMKGHYTMLCDSVMQLIWLVFIFIFIAGAPAVIEVDIMVRSMGPISEVDMVWLRILLLLNFEFIACKRNFLWTNRTLTLPTFVSIGIEQRMKWAVRYCVPIQARRWILQSICTEVFIFLCHFKQRQYTSEISVFACCCSWK